MTSRSSISPSNSIISSLPTSILTTFSKTNAHLRSFNLKAYMDSLVGLLEYYILFNYITPRHRYRSQLEPPPLSVQWLRRTTTRLTGRLCKLTRHSQPAEWFLPTFSSFPSSSSPQFRICSMYFGSNAIPRSMTLRDTNYQRHVFESAIGKNLRMSLQVEFRS